MALDRIVSTKNKEDFSYESVFDILENYLGKAGTASMNDNALKAVKLSGPKLIIANLHGEHSDPYKKIDLNDDRYFEVFVSDDFINVMTRFADSYTKAVAEGFAQVLSRMAESSIKYA